MKFLCVACDEPMKFQSAKGPDRGSLTAVFQCPSCRKETALLLNPWETQLVSSLDVKVGGKSVPAEPPLEMAETYLEKPAGDAGGTEPDAFAKFFGGSKASGGKCPFAGVAGKMMDGQVAAAEPFPWTMEASRRLERIPAFVRPMAKVGIEKFAAERGYSEVNDAVMDAAKETFGM
jgi:hypothetical protein